MSPLETIVAFGVCASLSAVIVEALAIRRSHKDAQEALGFFRYSKLTPKGRKYAARVCRCALDMGHALGANPESFARSWMGDWWERLSVDVERPEPPSQSPSTDSAQPENNEKSEDSNADD